MSDNDERLARLEALEEIRRIKVEYALACDRHFDADAIADLFAEDATFDAGKYGGGLHEGRAAIHAYFVHAGQTIPWGMHFVSAPAIDLADDLVTASASWYLWEMATMVEPEGRTPLWMAARYYDTYRVVDGSWKFASVRLESDMLTPYDKGWVRERIKGEPADA